MTPKFIYFDLDDTLLDHKGAEAAALKDVHTRFEFLSEVDIQKLIDVYHIVNKGQWEQYSQGMLSRSQLQQNRFEFTLQKLNLDPTQYAKVGNCYINCYRNYWEWIEGAQEVFTAISEKFEVGILTNGFSETQKLKFKQFDLSVYAQYLVVSEEVGALKPHPEIFRHATDLTGCDASEILYIGDSFTSDVLGGAAYGWKTAWFTTEMEGNRLNKADFVFSDFRKLYSFLDV